MNARFAIAAALAASAAALAAAQDPAAGPANSVNPANPIQVPNGDIHDTARYTLVPESVASASVSGGPDAEMVNNIVATLNADPSLRGSKITVQPDNGGITLSGATETPEQAQHAMEIANQVAGEGKVINAIRDSRA